MDQRDKDAKNRGRPTSRISQPGAVAATVENDGTTEAATEPPREPAAVPATALRQMEQDAHLKARARSSRAAMRSSEETAIQQMEQDAMAKSQSNNSSSRNERVMAKMMAARGDSTKEGGGKSRGLELAPDGPNTAMTSLRSMEGDLMAKSASGRFGTGEKGAGVASRGVSDNTVAVAMEKDSNEEAAVVATQDDSYPTLADNGYDDNGYDDNAFVQTMDVEDQQPTLVVDDNENDDDDMNPMTLVGETTTQQDTTVPSTDTQPPPSAPEGSGVQAFLADEHIIDATQVVGVMSTEEEEKLDEQRQRRILCIGIAIFLVIVLVVVGIAVYFTTRGSEPGTSVPTGMPSSTPSATPSASPTSGRFAAIRDLIATLMGTDQGLDVLGSFQSRALRYVATQDELAVPLGDPQLVQRYALAVFHYMTGGEDWTSCGQTDGACASGRWLFGTASECDWFGITCDSNNNVERISREYIYIHGVANGEGGLFGDKMRMDKEILHVAYTTHSLTLVLVPLYSLSFFLQTFALYTCIQPPLLATTWRDDSHPNSSC